MLYRDWRDTLVSLEIGFAMVFATVPQAWAVEGLGELGLAELGSPEKEVIQ